MVTLKKPSLHVTQQDNGLMLVQYSVGPYPKSIPNLTPGPELMAAIADGLKAQEDFQNAAIEADQKKRHDDVLYGVGTKEGMGHGIALAHKCFPRQLSNRERKCLITSGAQFI